MRLGKWEGPGKDCGRLNQLFTLPQLDFFLKEALDFLKEKYRLGNLSSVGEFNNSTESYTGLLKC